jgi:hypothetical protein
MNISIKQEQTFFGGPPMYRLRVIAKSTQEMNRVIRVLLNPFDSDITELIKEQDEKKKSL